MDMIIRLIINIFKEIFEQDSERRQKEHQRRQELIRQWQARQRAEQEASSQTARGTPGMPPQPLPVGQVGGAPQPVQSKKPELIRQIEALFGQIAPQEPPPPPPPPKPKRKEAVHKTRYTSKFNKEPKKKAAPKKKPRKAFQLPGKTPLEQLIYAKVILDPCKAYKDDLL